MDVLNCDVAEKILTTLVDHGPQTIPELLLAMKIHLVPLLRALQDVNEFHLVKLTDDGAVQLSALGNRTAIAIRGNEIRAEATKRLEGPVNASTDTGHPVP